MLIDRIAIEYSLTHAYTFLLVISRAVYSRSNPQKPIRNGTFQNGKYMQTYVIKSYFDYGPTLCLRSCSSYSGCNGINYQSSPHLICELLRVSGKSTLTVNREFRYSDLSSWIIEPNACWPNPCALHHYCVVPDYGAPMCRSFKSNLDGLKNIAIGKPAYMNSQFENYLVSYGNDGRYDTLFHTGSSGYNYWYIDLGSFFDIQRIELFNRDVCPERLQNLDVTIGTTLELLQLCGHFKGPGVTRQHVVIICPVWMVGRYVKLIQHNDIAASYLHLFEVEVYGYQL